MTIIGADIKYMNIDTIKKKLREEFQATAHMMYSPEDFELFLDAAVDQVVQACEEEEKNYKLIAEPLGNVWFNDIEYTPVTASKSDTTWSERFDKEFYDGEKGLGIRRRFKGRSETTTTWYIKQFFQNLLDTQAEELEKELRAQQDIWLKEGRLAALDEVKKIAKERMEVVDNMTDTIWTRGYFDALKDFIDALEKLKGKDITSSNEKR